MGPLERLLEGWSRLRGWYPVEMAGSAYHCDPDHISFWEKVNREAWEPQTLAVLGRLLKPGTVYCDIGAWIGPTVLYAARRCDKVFCLEPDRVAYMYLLQNLKLNKLENVLPFNLALSAHDALGRMASPRGKRGDSMTSLLKPDGAAGMEVLCLSWPTWLGLAGMPVFGVIKMDIEGGEFSLLPAMAEYLATLTPALYLSLHPHLLPENERFEAMSRVVAVLQSYGTILDESGKRQELSSLLEAQALHAAGTYLLLP